MYDISASFGMFLDNKKDENLMRLQFSILLQTSGMVNKEQRDTVLQSRFYRQYFTSDMASPRSHAALVNQELFFVEVAK